MDPRENLAWLRSLSVVYELSVEFPNFGRISDAYKQHHGEWPKIA